MFKLHKIPVKIKYLTNIYCLIKPNCISYKNNVRFLSDQKLETKTYENFNDLLQKRRDEANQSIIIQVNSEKSFPELFNYCSQYGEIRSAHHYTISNNELHYILIEYSNHECSEKALTSSQFNKEISGVPVKSPFLWFRAGKNTKGKQNRKISKEFQLNIENGTSTISNDDINELLRTAEHFDDQLKILFNSTHLNDLEARLRFLAARQIEMSLCGMFPQAKAFPFGSSINGFGKMGCDLDLILRLYPEEEVEEEEYSRLIFHTKENLTNGRSQTQRQMECVGDMLHLFLPGVFHVRRILQARVPIIKYHHDHMDLEVDLSMSNMTGVYMSELLYMFGQIDDRVRPLVFCIRKWAISVGLTNSSPGRWISNFSLTTLVLFFLQQLKKPILPSINFIAEKARKCDIRITEDDINCTFLRDLNQLNFHTINTDSYETLLLQFYEFYSQFDFQNKAISLNEGRVLPKPDHSPMYIINPIELTLNVSKNVSCEETDKFRIEVRNAAWILESNTQRPSDRTDNLTEWGILNLFKTTQKSVIRPQMFFKPRMVDVSELFNEATDTSTDYKNSYVKNQINSIKDKAKIDMKKLKQFTESHNRR